MHGHKFESADEATRFIQAGNATITLKSLATETRFTYRVRESEDGRCFFVSLMNGSDNESSFAYIGIIRDGEFRWTVKSRVSKDAPSFRAFAWMFKNVIVGNAIPSALEIWHEGRCGRCGRKLTVPESIASGIGPECAGRMSREPMTATLIMAG